MALMMSTNSGTRKAPPCGCHPHHVVLPGLYRLCYHRMSINNSGALSHYIRDIGFHLSHSFSCVSWLCWGVAVYLVPWDIQVHRLEGHCSSPSNYLRWNWLAEKQPSKHWQLPRHLTSPQSGNHFKILWEAIAALCPINSSDSPKMCLFSEWPNTAHVTPKSLIMPGLISPVVSTGHLVAVLNNHSNFEI